MVVHTAPQAEVDAIGRVIRCLHGLVTAGPWDLDIAWAMSAHGYDETKWAEGQGILAELVSSEAPESTTLQTAESWCEEAASVARSTLAADPQLLAKLGLSAGCNACPALFLVVRPAAI